MQEGEDVGKSKIATPYVCMSVSLYVCNWIQSRVNCRLVYS